MVFAEKMKMKVIMILYRYVSKQKSYLILVSEVPPSTDRIRFSQYLHARMTVAMTITSKTALVSFSFHPIAVLFQTLMSSRGNRF
jgi:hypothetical protein